MYKFFKILRGISKRVHSRIIYNLIRLQYQDKIKKRKKDKVNSFRLDKHQKKEIANYYKQFNIKISTNWHELFIRNNNDFDVRFVPEDLFYSKIEPMLNSNAIMYPALEDKNLTDKILSNFNQPKIIIKNINGFYIYKNSLMGVEQVLDKLKSQEKFILKKSILSYGGKGVEFVNKNQSKDINFLKELLNNFESNFIIQEVVEQNEYLKSLNESSLNTIRILSYLRKNECVILSSVLRVGSKGNSTDNLSSGGMCCSLNTDGSSKRVGYDAIGREYKKLHGELSFENIKVPFYEEATEMVKKMHILIPYFRLISWDIAIDANNQPILIEYNTCGQAVNTHQYTKPLFGEYTDEILKMVSSSK